MADAPRRERTTRRRLMLLAVVALAHLAVLALLNLTRPGRMLALGIDNRPVSLITLAGPPGGSPAPKAPAPPAPKPKPKPVQVAQAEPPPTPEPPPPEPPPEPSPPEPDPPPPVDPAAEPSEVGPVGPVAPTLAAAPLAAGTTQPAGGGQDCHVEQVVQAALRARPEAQAGLARIPRGSRTVANVILIWSGRWTDPAPLGGSEAVDPIRGVILETLRTLSPECQNQIVIGPRLLLLGPATGDTALAVGGGSWRWAELAFEEPAPTFLGIPLPTFSWGSGRATQRRP